MTDPRNSSNEDEKSTVYLEQVFAGVDGQKDLNEFMDNLPEEKSSFADYFFSLPQVMAIDNAKLWKDADIDRSLFNHIRQGIKRPGRDKILRMCIAAGLDAKETKRALEMGGVAPLYMKDRRDVAISWCMKRHMSVMETNLYLDEHDFDPLS